MSNNNQFLLKENWDQIQRGWIFEAVVAFTPERPLDFFVVDENDSSKGSIVRNCGTFVPGKTQKAIIELKTRKVLIISNDEISSNPHIPDVTVAPIYGIYPDTRLEPWYPDLVHNQHPYFAHLPKEVTGMECLVDLTNIISINKNMLLTKRYDISEKVEEVERRINYCLSLGANKQTLVDNEDEHQTV